MKQLEEAVSSERPQENSALTLVHSRLLCTNRELKGLKPGEEKYPYRSGLVLDCMRVFSFFVARVACAMSYDGIGM